MTLTDVTDPTESSFVVDLSTEKDFQSPTSSTKSVPSPSQSVSSINSSSLASTSPPSPPKELTIEDGKVVSFNFDELNDVSAHQLFQVRKKRLFHIWFISNVFINYRHR